MKPMEQKDLEIEQLKNELLESRTAMHAAISAANIYYFEYFPEENYALQYHGKELFSLKERLEHYPDSWFEKKLTHPDDVPTLKDAFQRMKQGEKSASCEVRNLTNGQYRWHQYHFTSIYDAAGCRKKVVCTAQDISESKKVAALNTDFLHLFTRTPGWIFTCRNDAVWTLQRTSAGILEATGYTAEEFAEEMHNEIVRIIPAQYRPKIRNEILRMQEEGYGSRTAYETPIIHKDGSFTWLQVSLYWDKNDSDGLLYCSCTDITQLKNSQEELRESNAMYELTTRHASMNLWKYDIANDVLYNTITTSKKNSYDKIVPNFIQATVASGVIRQDSIDDFIQLYHQLKAGAESASADIWVRTLDQKSWWCERITYVTVFDDAHRPSKAFGLGRDITELKEAEKRIETEKEFQNSVESEKLLLKTRCNITEDQVEALKTQSEMRAIHPANTFSGGVSQLTDNAYSPDDRRLLTEMFSIEKLESAAKGNIPYSFEYQRRDRKGHPAWIKVSIKVIYHPDTKALIGFVNISDINAEKKMSAIISRIAEVDYEVLALLYAQTDEIEPIRFHAKNDIAEIDYTTPYHVSMERFVQQNIVLEQQEQAKKAFSIEQIKKALSKSNTYEISFALKGTSRRQKTWQFAYFDDTTDTIIYTRTDVTKIFREQEQQREALKSALLQAEEASKAKSNFLSRMSHEIRTPMNAIIGMNALAIQSIHQPEQVHDYLSKVGISARFLLSLINDILDMSRIESGKVTLKNAKFPLEEFVHSVNDIVYGQATQKGIDYDCVISSYTADYYIGDAVKLQQILVNLLGNSIKFTPAGGKVQLIIRQERTEADKAYMSFSVNDTGIGISPELQKTMFEPFEQGDLTMTTPYKGTGLGLAIAKNLVTMMGGTISVNSIEGVGSEFMVRVPLTRCEEETYQKIHLNMPLEKLKTLIVDDDIVICEHTAAMLVEIGMKAEWVESGLRAVELIRQRWNRKDYFNIVLLDWKMPEMDGIETARQIRKIVGEDVTIIVMTAYDWSEIEQEAKMAGVNLLVTKPLFKSSLISVFESAFQAKKQESAQPQIEHYDFTGKRILLVEDHILNVEVAKRLLESKHAVVEVAENGLRSIEMFMEAPEKYYDVILMDIRMPIMDGLTATKSIRQLRKPSAKSIPIIAMSANAFDEDIEKSKAAGMNEHLSKPIEPQTLFAVLNKWFQHEQDE